MSEVVIIIPALDEERAIAKVIKAIPSALVAEIVVVDNDSSDSTAEIARNAGATVIYEAQKGYGFACLKGIAYVRSTLHKVDIVVFLDADYSDYPEEIVNLIQPIIQNNYDLVIGSRILGNREKGAMSLYQVFGNRIATRVMSLLYQAHFTDLGPFRAIKFDKLLNLGMKEKTYGWTMEMQLKAVKQKLRYCEVPVRYRQRIGNSKISGTFKGSLRATLTIATMLLRYISLWLILY
jgi:glycosyltransferase involved in cell wall biosynthesis